MHGMKRKQQCHKPAPPEPSRHPFENPEENHGAGHMKKQIGEMMAPGL
jgi:hypothetical protein